MSKPYIYSFTEPIDPTMLHELFQQTNWAQGRDPLDIQQMLDNTQLVLGVWDEDKLIGFARVITDDIYRALIEDVVVDGAYRRQGIGHEIVDKLLKRLEHVERIMLDCDPTVEAFYSQHGFMLKTSTSMQLIQTASI